MPVSFKIKWWVVCVLPLKVGGSRVWAQVGDSAGASSRHRKHKHCSKWWRAPVHPHCTHTEISFIKRWLKSNPELPEFWVFTHAPSRKLEGYGIASYFLWVFTLGGLSRPSSQCRWHRRKQVTVVQGIKLSWHLTWWSILKVNSSQYDTTFTFSPFPRYSNQGLDKNILQKIRGLFYVILM